MRTFWTVVLTLLFTVAFGGAVYGVVKYYKNKYQPEDYTITIMEDETEIEQFSLEEQTELLVYLNSKYSSATGYEYVYHIDTKDGVLMASNYKLVRDITLFREKQLINYTITYNLNGGTLSTANATTYTYETKTFTLNNPTKDGYTFAGWVGSNGDTPNKAVAIEKNSTGNKSYEAQWTSIKYTITYNLADGTNSSNNPSVYTVEDGFDFANASKTGYDFVGWYTEQEFTNAITSVEVGSKGNLNLYAKFIVHQYAVRFMNGTQLIETKYYTVENNATDFIVAPVVPTLKGYQNISWASFTIIDKTEDITVMLLKTPIEYTVTFKGLPGGDIVKTYTIETIDLFTFPEINQSANPGYEMAWNLTKQDLNDLGNKEVTFSQTPIVYNITYNLNGGSVAGTNPTTYTVESIISLISPTKAGYTFAGWYDGNTRVYDVYGKTGDITLDAHYTLNTYYVYFKEGSTIIDTKEYSVENRTIEVPPAPARDGYTTKWESFSIATGIGNKTVNLIKTPIDYSITYETYGGINSYLNPTTYNVETATITLQDPIRAGYTFAGWYLNSNFTGSKVTTIAKGSTGNKSLYAKYTVIPYTITYYLNGGTNGANPDTYNIESATITLKDATKSGYKFIAWHSDSVSGTVVTQIANGSTGNVSLYAEFVQLETYSVSLKYTLGGKFYGAAEYQSITVTGALGEYDVYYILLGEDDPTRFGSLDAFAQYLYTEHNSGREVWKVNDTEVNTLNQFKTEFISAVLAQTSAHDVTIHY